MHTTDFAQLTQTSLHNADVLQVHERDQQTHDVVAVHHPEAGLDEHTSTSEAHDGKRMRTSCSDSPAWLSHLASAVALYMRKCVMVSLAAACTLPLTRMRCLRTGLRDHWWSGHELVRRRERRLHTCLECCNPGFLTSRSTSDLCMSTFRVVFGSSGHVKRPAGGMLQVGLEICSRCTGFAPHMTSLLQLIMHICACKFH